ncbi:MAG: thiamine-phosphate synthase family protein [candidate division WOR-3 bacterium]
MSIELRSEVIRSLNQAVRRLELCREFSALVPEVRSNIAYSLPLPQSTEDVAAVDGRITVVAGMPNAAGPVRFGASDHLARLLIVISHHDPSLRAVLNFRWHETILTLVADYCREQNLALGAIDRTHEPTELIGKDRSSMPWKVKTLLAASSGQIPPVFYENRGWGKEPLFVLVGPDPMLLVERAAAIAARYAALRDNE